MSKLHITLAFLVNAAGDKGLPIVIGKAASPKCFKGVKDKKKALVSPTILTLKLDGFCYHVRYSHDAQSEICSTEEKCALVSG